jgi:hypothetical protein
MYPGYDCLLVKPAAVMPREGGASSIPCLGFSKDRGYGIIRFRG